MLKRAARLHIAQERNARRDALDPAAAPGAPAPAVNQKRKKLDEFLVENRSSRRLFNKVSSGKMPATEAQRTAADIMHDYVNHDD